VQFRGGVDDGGGVDGHSLVGSEKFISGTNGPLFVSMLPGATEAAPLQSCDATF
jgi:hypothetical protein